MGDKQSYDDLEIVEFRGQRGMSVYVIEVTDLKYEVICDL